MPEEVEWAYAFDVHCNSFFPLVLTLHVVQLVLMPIITLHNIVSVLVANTLYLVAVRYAEAGFCRIDTLFCHCCLRIVRTSLAVAICPLGF